MRLKCSLASLHQWKKKLIVLKPTGTLASLQCRYIIFEMTFDWYSQNVWNNTYGPTIHLFPIRLLRKNFWCYKMKKEGNLIIMLTDFSANDVLCSERWHIRIHFRCIISQFLWYGFFFQLCMIFMPFNDICFIICKSWRFLLWSHLHVIRKKKQRRRGNSINEDHFKCQTLPPLQFMRAKFHSWYAAY